MHELKHQRWNDASTWGKIVGTEYPEFADDGQKDTAEFIVKLNEILSLDEKLKIEINVKMTCTKCKKSKLRTEEVNGVTKVSIEKQLMFDEVVTDNSIEKILSKSRKETVKKKCDDCSPNKDVDFEFERQIASTSDAVLVSLKRFLTDFETGISEKVKTQVDPTLRITIKGQKYQLKGVIEHHGNTIAEGHYTCTLKTEHEWKKINDSQISTTSTPADGYVFLYQKEIDQPEVIQQSQALPSTEPESSNMQPTKVKPHPHNFKLLF